MKKKLIIGVSILTLLVIACVGAIHLKNGYDEKNQSGILLAFDDYDTDSWEAAFERFREQGYEFVSFAYPYGKYSSETNEMLLEHFNVLRGAFYHELRDKDEVKGTFIESKSIDNVNYVDTPEFERELMAVLLETYENPGTVVSLYSHSVNDWAEWAVSVERLEFIFETAQNLGLEFYTYSDLVK